MGFGPHPRSRSLAICNDSPRWRSRDVEHDAGLVRRVVERGNPEPRSLRPVVRKRDAASPRARPDDQSILWAPVISDHQTSGRFPVCGDGNDPAVIVKRNRCTVIVAIHARDGIDLHPDEVQPDGVLARWSYKYARAAADDGSRIWNRQVHEIAKSITGPLLS